MRSAALSPLRVVALVTVSVVCLHFVASFMHEEYGRLTSISNITSKIISTPSRPSPPIPPSDAGPPKTAPSSPPPTAPNDQIYSEKRENATFVILCRNNQLWDAVRSVRGIEDRFNHLYHYPYVFLNEVPFTEEFKSTLSNIASSEVEFGLIPKDDWYQPDWIDVEKADKARAKMEADQIIYGGSLSYRNMCRFNSGFFFRHPLMQKYKWYWRIEPDVHFHCDIMFDPFRFMAEANKTYAFTISMFEYEATIPTLWGHVRDFMALHPEYVAPDNALGFISDNGGERYNLCHFWSNFEIANMDFWRSEKYMKFFDYLDSKGGFYYERWGDAPVHSIAAAIFAPRDQIHFFDEIGYEHSPYTHCPKEGDHYSKGRCACNPSNNVDMDGISCLNRFMDFMRT